MVHEAIKMMCQMVIGKDFGTDAFVFYDQYMACLNRSHTVLLKIKTSIRNTRPYILHMSDAVQGRYDLKELDFSKYLDRDCFTCLTLFNEHIFDNMGYAASDYSKVKELLDKVSWDDELDEPRTSTLLIQCGEYEGLFFNHILEQLFIVGEANDLSVKMISKDSPLFVKYSFEKFPFDFEVHGVAAPRIDDHSKGDYQCRWDEL